MDSEIHRTDGIGLDDYLSADRGDILLLFWQARDSWARRNIPTLSAIATIFICSLIAGKHARAAIPERQQRQCPRLCGNADTYGIGIRIATYLQLALTIFVNKLSPRHAVALAPVNVWLIFALSVAFSTMIARHQEIPIIDLMILDKLGSSVISVTLIQVLAGADLNIWLVVRPGEYIHETALTRLMQYCVMALWFVGLTLFSWHILPNSNWSQMEFIPTKDGGCRLTKAQPATGCEVVTWSAFKGAEAIANDYYQINSIFLPIVGLVLFALQFWHLGIILWHVLLLDLRKFNAKVCGVGDSEQTHDKQGGRICLPRKSQIIFDCLCVWPLGEFKGFFKIFKKPARDRSGSLVAQQLVDHCGLSSTPDLAQEPIDRCLLFLLIQYRIPLERLEQSTRDQVNQSSGRGPQPASKIPTGSVAALRRTFSQAFTYIWLPIQITTGFSTIVEFELTIVLNNIGDMNDLDSAGQLIAFIVGVGGCIAVGMHLITHQRKEKYGAPLYDGGSVPRVAMDLEAQGQPRALHRRATY